MAFTTPVSSSKSAALTRILDCVPRGYTRYMSGSIAVTKAPALASKFHRLYAIAATPAQRITRKKHGLANCLLVLYWPESATKVEWLLLATDGSGLEDEAKNLRTVTDRLRLVWLGYELVRHNAHGRLSWTWRRTSKEMHEIYGLLNNQLKHRHHSAVRETLSRAARQPGFRGVREQSWRLCAYARSSGYEGELPTLFFMQKIRHGEPLRIVLE